MDSFWSPTLPPSWPPPISFLLMATDRETEVLVAKDLWGGVGQGHWGPSLAAPDHWLQGGLQAGESHALPNTVFRDILREPVLAANDWPSGWGRPCGFPSGRSLERPSGTGTARVPDGSALCNKGSSSGLVLDHCSAQMSDSPPSQRSF